MPKAYLIVEVETTDPELMAKYREGTPAAIARHGGKFIVRGGAAHPLEGGWTPPRIVVVEFPSLQKAKDFYACPHYKPLLEMRLKAGKNKAILVEGAE
ncbi:MAG: hypothetical protein K0S54_2968 [Alphaproteobacteria bacterium]|jgi:uncharacterized protein (DUF1330 family)|nr:hypothetical protein [Alphaproteobacteria bacterium]